jgi:hypothetical protein
VAPHDSAATSAAPTSSAPTTRGQNSTGPTSGATTSTQPPSVGGCTTNPDVAPTAQGRAYLLAVQAAQPSWNLVTYSLASENGEVHHNDLVEQAVGDRGFLTSLRAISFTGSAAVPADFLTSALDTYVTLLDEAAAHPGYFSAQQRLFAQIDNARAEASGQLRSSLGLPSSNCTVLRP